MKNAIALVAVTLLASGPRAVLHGADSTVDGGEAITFNEHIGPIVHSHCSSCHRPGKAAPFPLLTYEDVAKRAPLIRAVTQSRYMPPWHAEPGYGSFKGERRMLDSEVDLLARWIDGGAPEGSGPPAAPPEFASDWTLGTPDAVVEMEQAFTVPADGPDVYRNFVARIPIAEDRWVRAIEFRPRARTVVHHSLFRADPSGRARELDTKDDAPGFGGMAGGISGSFSLGGWAVGGNAREFPEEAPILVPAGSDFLFQSHFHPSGKEETEVSAAALYFTDRPATRTRLSIPLPPRFGAGAGIEIAPGESDFTIAESFTLPAAIDIHAVTPHAHYIGKEFKGWAELPSGEEVPLIWIKDWDFAWQDRYVYDEPVRLPAGTTIHSRIRYDNSAENPRNPSNPPKRIFWGRQSKDEMGTLIFSGMPVDEADAPAIRKEIAKQRQQHTKQAREYIAGRRRAADSGSN